MKVEGNDAKYKLDSRIDRRFRRFLRKFETITPCSRSKGLMEAGKDRGTGIGKGGESTDEEYGGYLTSLQQCDPLHKDYEVVYISEDDDMDPEYKAGLDCLRKDGNTLLLVGPSKDGVSKVLRIEEEEDDVSDCVNEGSPVDCNKGKTGSAVLNLGSVKGIEREKAEVKRLDSRQRSLHSSRHEGNQNMVSDSDCDLVDDCYVGFLNCIRTEGGNIVAILRGGKEISLFEDEDSSSDSEVLVVDPFCGGCYTPFVPSQEYLNVPGEKNWADTKTPFRSPFRENLMDLLKKPFSQSEYDDLWKELNRKKPIEGHLELRDGREIKKTINSTGKSYLDDHRDFFKMIDSAKRDRFKKLSLFRGFFYWLQNRPQYDSFKPWSDAAFLEAL